MPMMLVPLDGGDPVALDKAILLFGRHPDCDVVLASSRKVSRKHCCLAQIHDYYVVRDLGSMNGVRVNGEPAGREHRLEAGDELIIGDVGYRLTVGSLPKPARKDGKPAAGARRVSPDMLSRDVPVAIPEEGEDFVVEQTRARQKRSHSAVRKPVKPKPKPKRPKDSDGVIMLGDDDIID